MAQIDQLPDIRSVFDQMGLLTESDRRRFAASDPLGESCSGEFTFIRLSNDSAFEGEPGDAKLA